MSYLTRNFPDNYPDIVCMCEHLCLELEDLMASRQESLRTMTECQCDVRTADLIFHPSTAGRR